MSFNLVAGFLLFSGIASITYQVTWIRLLALSMGNSSASVSTVLAAFFLGMALGSYWAEKIARNQINNLKPYILLEAVIGCAGLLLLPILLNLDSFVAQVPVFGTWLSLKFILAMTVLTIPTICMGATFPVMAALLVRQSAQMGGNISLLYGLNTLGAVLGAALSGFVFIPNWGLDGAIYIAAVINFAIAATAIYFNGKLQLAPLEVAPVTQHVTRDEGDSSRWRALAVLFTTGFAAIATQVGWTKYLSIFTGTTIYGFAAILTVFLLGIALGSLWIKRYIDRIHSPELWLASGLIALGFCLILTRVGLTWLPGVYAAVNHLAAPAAVVHGVKYTLIFLLLIIPTLLFGALFPINLKVYCGNLEGVRQRIGKAYAINTLASILGALAAGFWLIPSFGTNAVLTGCALAVTAVALVFLPNFRTVTRRAPLAAGVALTLVASIALAQLNYEDLVASVQYSYDDDASSGTKPTFHFLKESKTGVISVVSYDGSRVKLQNNGLNESVVNLHDPDDNLLAETLLGLMPYALQTAPKNAFVVGFGAGITTRTLTLTEIKSIHVVELDPVVIDAGLAIKSAQSDALSDPRVTLTINDARNTLLVEDTTYDIIVAQPSHPWLARASNVFTQEFWEIVASRLNEGGVFGQWVNLFNMDATTLKSILKGFYTVFPHGFTMTNRESGDLVMFGGKQPLLIDFDRLDQLVKQENIKPILAKDKIRDGKDLIWYFSFSRDDALAAAGDAQPNTDTNILSEVRLSTLVAQPTGAEDPYEFIDEHYSADFASAYRSNDIAGFYYENAMMFLAWDNFFKAKKIADRLEKLGQDTLAQAVRYEVAWRQLDYDKAFSIYDERKDWNGRIYLLHALALLELGRRDEAFNVIDHIQDSHERHAAETRLLADAGEWTAVADRLPETLEDKRWHYAGLAFNNAVADDFDLATLLHMDLSPIPLMRAVVQHAGATKKTEQIDRWSQRLADAIDMETKRLAKLGNKVLDDNEIPRALLIINRLAKVNPDAQKLRALRWRYERATGFKKSPLEKSTPADVDG